MNETGHGEKINMNSLDRRMTTEADKRIKIQFFVINAKLTTLLIFANSKNSYF